MEKVQFKLQIFRALLEGKIVRYQRGDKRNRYCWLNGNDFVFSYNFPNMTFETWYDTHHNLFKATNAWVMDLKEAPKKIQKDYHLSRGKKQ